MGTQTAEPGGLNRLGGEPPRVSVGRESAAVTAYQHSAVLPVTPANRHQIGTRTTLASLPAIGILNACSWQTQGETALE